MISALANSFVYLGKIAMLEGRDALDSKILEYTGSDRGGGSIS